MDETALDSNAAITVRRMEPGDLPQAAEVHRLAFIRQARSVEWLRSNLNAEPKNLCYAAFSGAHCVGYIIWSQKAGFRPEAVLELEQIAVSPDHQGKGIGKALISLSLPEVARSLEAQGSTLKHILVTTRADNHAQQLYRSLLGAEVEATISGLYSADEVIMVARNVNNQVR
ncbi:N-acetyltransferase [uncultured Halopseudomonas sp.]|uniref:GNAT family N-acetyltransferase n=1 Tax=uncultured Halopseudomonas sp. TaxID=2901193 RepID=UPI0030EDB403